jgi:hypothetical protein
MADWARGEVAPACTGRGETIGPECALDGGRAGIAAETGRETSEDCEGLDSEGDCGVSTRSSPDNQCISTETPVCPFDENLW